MRAVTKRAAGTSWLFQPCPSLLLRYSTPGWWLQGRGQEGGTGAGWTGKQGRCCLASDPRCLATKIWACCRLSHWPLSLQLPRL
ncbi:hypothetical protein ABBQ32_010813 [Trebouxia sp. C0010 RCD-2024]